MKVTKTLISFIVLALVYVTINLTVAPPRATLEQYHVNSATMRLINLSVVIPVIAIWFVSLYGYTKLRAYSSHIKDNNEGRYVELLTRGVMVMTIMLPITSTLSAILNIFARDKPGYLAASTVFINFITLLFYLVSFWYISKGGRKLSDLAKQRPSQRGMHAVAVLLIVGAVFYGYLVSNARSDLFSIYHMPLFAVLATIVVPYLFSWYLGIVAAYDIHLYTRTVKGELYRRSWNAMAYGIIWLLVFSIVLQYITTVSAKLKLLPLASILVLIYFILAVRVVGYLLIARGAKTLTKIEEV